MYTAGVAILAVLLTLFVTLLVINLSGGEKSIKYQLRTDYGVKDPQFLHVMGQLLGPPIVSGNQITGLQNGVEIFPPMLAAIRSASKTICFETYIYWSGTIGAEFASALADRARNGVQVHVLLDWLGTDKIDGTLLTELKKAGAEVIRYRPLRWYNLPRMNNRTHRKLLVIDGCIGFTGGVGIADVWLGNADSSHHWRDSHFQIEGPAVAQLQAAFMDNWVKVRSSVLHDESYFPLLEPVGPTRAQVFKSSSHEGAESVRLMYLLSIAAAERSILLGNAYFVPDNLSVRALIAAKERGVKVQIIVPSAHTDMPLVRRASRSLWGPLLEAGIEIHEFQPTMYHCKIMIVDGLWTSVGSTNFDNRSFRLNDEANLNVFDREFATEQSRYFELDRSRSKRITFEEWKNRPVREKCAELFAGLFRSQL